MPLGVSNTVDECQIRSAHGGLRTSRRFRATWPRPQSPWVSTRAVASTPSWAGRVAGKTAGCAWFVAVHLLTACPTRGVVRHPLHLQTLYRAGPSGAGAFARHRARIAGPISSSRAHALEPCILSLLVTTWCGGFDIILRSRTPPSTARACTPSPRAFRRARRSLSCGLHAVSVPPSAGSCFRCGSGPGRCFHGPAGARTPARDALANIGIAFGISSALRASPLAGIIGSNCLYLQLQQVKVRIKC